MVLLFYIFIDTVPIYYMSIAHAVSNAYSHTGNLIIYILFRPHKYNQFFPFAAIHKQEETSRNHKEENCLPLDCPLRKANSANKQTKRSKEIQKCSNSMVLKTVLSKTTKFFKNNNNNKKYAVGQIQTGEGNSFSSTFSLSHFICENVSYS